LTLAREHGIYLTPVWNKSNREHHIIGSHPRHTYQAAREAVLDSKWQGEYFIDADHIRLDTVDPFIHYANFFTIDVADAIGKTPDKKIVDPFIKLARQLPSTLKIEGLPPISVNNAVLMRMAVQYLAAIDQAHQIYQYIHEQKGGQPFVVEISMDEVAMPVYVRLLQYTHQYHCPKILRKIQQRNRLPRRPGAVCRRIRTTPDGTAIRY
jgi:hypothetical protein